MRNKNGQFDWKATLSIVIVVLVFIYAGVWWGIGAFIVGSVILGWKYRHSGPFPTNRGKSDSDTDEGSEI